MKKPLNIRLDPGQIECPDEAMVKVYKQLSPMERIKIASDMWDSAWQQTDAILRSLHPDWSEERIKKEIIRRLAHNEDI